MTFKKPERKPQPAGLAQARPTCAPHPAAYVETPHLGLPASAEAGLFIKEVSTEPDVMANWASAWEVGLPAPAQRLGRCALEERSAPSQPGQTGPTAGPQSMRMFD